MKTRNIFKTSYWIIIITLCLLAITFGIAYIIKLLGNDSAMSVLTPIFIIPTYIGLIGLLPSFLAMKLGYKVWYNKHEGEISNRRPKIDIRT